MTLGDRLQWITSASSGGPLDPESLVSGDRLQPWEDTRWVLVRDDEPVVTVDNFGWLETDGRVLDLHSRYRELDGRLYRLVLEVFGRLLP